MRTLTLRLPWPPSVNHYYGRAKSGHTYLKEAGRLYRKKAAAEFARLGWPRLEGAVRVRLVLSPPDRRKRDIDNIRKAIYDALSDRKHRRVVVHRGVIADDAAIREDEAVFAEAGEGMVEIHITEIGENNGWEKEAKIRNDPCRRQPGDSRRTDGGASEGRDRGH